MRHPPRTRTALLALCVTAALAGCDSGDDDSDATPTTDTDTTDTDTTDTDTTDAGATDVSLGDCESDTDLATVVCASEAFLATLDESERGTAVLDFTDTAARTTWSNLPGVERYGVRFGDLGAESLAAAKTVALAALGEAGYEDFEGLLAADDYLGTLEGDGGGMGPGGGGQYTSDNYYIAFHGEPSAADDWMLQIGGHHMAYNVTWIAGTGYPTPNFVGVEPKGSFEVNSTTYAPLAAEGDAMISMFESLSETEFETALLEGETYSDILVGPDNGSGVLPSDEYPVAGNRGGVFVSNLTAEQQALVVAAIEQWVGDVADDVSAPLMADYTSDEAMADTLIAWSAEEPSNGIDVDVANTYMRIDGPRLWIEFICQNGVIVQGETHYHTIYRDKQFDYGNSL